MKELLSRSLLKDLRVNTFRYNVLLLLFFLVYYGEVLLSGRLLHQLSSVERQFWGWWFLISVLQVVPVGLSFGLLFLTISALFIALTLGLSIVTELGLWIFYLLVTIVMASLISAWQDR